LTRSALLAYGWPGNVQEVKRVIERVAFRYAENEDIFATMLALPNWSESTG
jgi:transcriptional regulator with PAS, ATPase and Fis domain